MIRTSFVNEKPKKRRPLKMVHFFKLPLNKNNKKSDASILNYYLPSLTKTFVRFHLDTPISFANAYPACCIRCDWITHQSICHPQPLMFSVCIQIMLWSRNKILPLIFLNFSYFNLRFAWLNGTMVETK